MVDDDALSTGKPNPPTPTRDLSSNEAALENVPPHDASTITFDEPFDTPTKAELISRELIVHRYVTLKTGSPASLSAFLDWIPTVHSSETLYKFSLRDWSRSATKIFQAAGLQIKKDVVLEEYEQVRRDFIRARELGEEAERLAGDKAWKDVRRKAFQLRSSAFLSNLTKVKPSSGIVEAGSEADLIDPGTGEAGSEADRICPGDAGNEADRVDPGLLSDSVADSVASAEDLTSRSVDGFDPAISVSCVNCRKRKLEGEEPPAYRKRHRASFPQRQILESDTTYAFRVLGYLTRTKVIAESQNRLCRKVLSDEVARGLTAALMEFAYDGDEQKAGDAVAAVAPPPVAPVVRLWRAWLAELPRTSLRLFNGLVMKGAKYAVIVAGTAVAQRYLMQK